MCWILGLYLENTLTYIVVLALAIPSLTPTRLGGIRFMYAGAGTFEEPFQGRYDEADGQL